MLEKYLQQQGFSKSTIKAYSKEILNFISWCDRENIVPEYATGSEVMGYIQYLQRKGQDIKTRSINLNMIKHYFGYVLHLEVRTDNPARQIKLRGTKSKKLYPILNIQELESLYHHYVVPEQQGRQHNAQVFYYTQLSKQRNRAIVSLMIYQGLATDEVNRLRVQDVKLKEGRVFIAGTRKSNERELELKSQQIMELMEYQGRTRKELLQLGKRETNLYFVQTLPTATEKVGNESCVNVWKRLSQELKKINPKFINFLQVRTSVITHWLQKYNLREVQYMAGHRYISTTESYRINNLEDLQQDVEQFHPIG